MIKLSEIRAGVALIRLWRIFKNIFSKEENQMNIKSGIKTSEFWVGVLAALLPFFDKFFDLRLPTEHILGSIGVIISYILSRTVVKAKSS